MSTVEDEIVAFIGVGVQTGDQILAGLSPTRKTHEVKQAIASLLSTGTITISIQDTSRAFNTWNLNTYDVV